MITDIQKISDVVNGDENAYLNMDCMEGMKQFPDNYFDLAICDPVYGGVTQGGYMKEPGGRRVGNGLADRTLYNQSIWQQEKTPKEYFDELFRVSKNQVIWGVITSQKA